MNTKILKQKILAELLSPAGGGGGWNQNEWERVKLNEIADISLGKTLDKQKNTGIYKPYLRSVNVRWGEIDLSDLKEMKFEKSETEKYSLQYNDLLICEGGEAGRCAIWKEKEVEMRFQNALHRVRFQNGNIPEFYMYYLMFLNDTNIIENYCKGVTIKHLTGTALRQILFPLPPLPVQKSIVAQIERLFAEIDRIETARQALLNLIKLTKQKTLEIAVSGKWLAVSGTDEWEMVKLGEVCEFIRNGATIKNNKDAKGFPITRIETISNGTVDYDRMGYADIFDISLYERYFLKENDILMSHINSPIHVGKSALYVPKEKNEVIIHGMNLLCFRLLKIIDAKFLNYYFNSGYFKEQIKPFIKNAVNQASINIGNLSGILIPLPPLPVQQQIVEKIDAIFAQLEIIEKTINK